MSKQTRKETPAAREAFEIYERLGAERTLEEVARITGRSLGSISAWSSRHRWKERLLEQAEAVAQAALEQSKESARELTKKEAEEWKVRQTSHRQEEWQMREKLMELANEGIRRWYDEADKPPTLEAIAKLLESASKLGRLATGLGTDRTEITGPDGGAMQLEIRAALARVYGNATTIDVEATPIGAVES